MNNLPQPPPHKDDSPVEESGNPFLEGTPHLTTIMERAPSQIQRWRESPDGGWIVETWGHTEHRVIESWKHWFERSIIRSSIAATFKKSFWLAAIALAATYGGYLATQPWLLELIDSLF